MKLYLSTAAPWYWCATWDTDSPNIGAVEAVDPDAQDSWASRILHAIAEAVLAYEDEAGELPEEPHLHLSSVQAAGAGDILRKLERGPWTTTEERLLSSMIPSKNMEIVVRPSSRQDMALVRDAKDLVGRSAAVEMMAGMGVARG